MFVCMFGLLTMMLLLLYIRGIKIYLILYIKMLNIYITITQLKSQIFIIIKHIHIITKCIHSYMFFQFILLLFLLLLILYYIAFLVVVAFQKLIVSQKRFFLRYLFNIKIFYILLCCTKFALILVFCQLTFFFSVCI